MKKFIFLIMLFVSSCSDSQTATRILKEQGFKNITITGYDFFTCGSEDFYSTGFIAYKNGVKIEGAVCSGFIYKGTTIRFH